MPTRTKLIILLLLVLILACTCVGTCAAYTPKQKPIKIDRFQSPDKPKIVLYYASWCGYSKMFLPIWDAFEAMIKADISDKVTPEKIKCEGTEEKTCYQQGVQGYPTVILYTKDGTHKFNGERTLEKLREFVMSHC